MHKINITGGVVPVSKWIKPDGVSSKEGQLWICANCGKGRHVWNEDSEEEQWQRCPDCDAIMVNN